MAIARTSMGSQLTGNREKLEHKAGGVSKKVRKSHRKHAKQRRRSLVLLVKNEGLTIGPHERSTVGKV
jgi:hypothetical protein